MISASGIQILIAFAGLFIFFFVIWRSNRKRQRRRSGKLHGDMFTILVFVGLIAALIQIFK